MLKEASQLQIDKSAATTPRSVSAQQRLVATALLTLIVILLLSLRHLLICTALAPIILLFFVIPMKARYLVALYGLLELYQGFYVMNSGVAHFAHLGGMLGGWLMIRYWRGQPPFRSRRGPGRRF